VPSEGRVAQLLGYALGALPGEGGGPQSGMVERVLPLAAASHDEGERWEEGQCDTPLWQPASCLRLPSPRALGEHP
jgi:hypothetical protein